MTTNPFDTYQAPKDNDKMTVLVSKASEAEELEMAIGALDEETKELSARLWEIKRKELPELMADLGIEDFKLSGGGKIELKEFVRGSLPKEEEPRRLAFEYLAELDMEGLIKTDVSFKFKKTEHNWSMNLVALAEENGYDAFVKTDVHPQTLYAGVKELLRDGKDVDMDKLGVYNGTEAKITGVKK